MLQKYEKLSNFIIKTKKERIFVVKMEEMTIKNLLDGRTPVIMGILNVTPDSFYAASRNTSVEGVVERARQMVAEGAAILDVGACSTRPQSTPVDETEERRRLLPALEAIHAELPEVPLSVDTFRSSVAEECVRLFGPFLIINDVSGGEAALPGVPYVLTCPTADPESFFDEQLPLLAHKGVTDVILDPGFGFGKTVEDNYRILSHLSGLRRFGLPLLVGVSRKSMIYKPLGITPDEALNGTSVLHTIALRQGASILRVHDVREAAQCVRLLDMLNKT